MQTSGHLDLAVCRLPPRHRERHMERERQGPNRDCAGMEIDSDSDRRSALICGIDYDQVLKLCKYCDTVLGLSV